MPDLSISCLDGSTSFVHQLDPRIRPVKCTKELLKGRKFDIITFTTQFHKANEHLGQAIPRVVVEFFWVNEIWMLYPTDHPEKRRLIGQAHSPKYEVYWEKLLHAEAFKAKRARQSSAEIWSFPRKLTKEEQKDKGLVLLGNREWEYFLPEVRLMPLYNVFFLQLAQKIIAANPGKLLGIELMRRLWRLLIREVYDFVDEAERMTKLEEAKAVTDEDFEKATRIAREALSKKREMASERDSDAETSKSRRQQSKRKKATVRGAGAEGFGDQTRANDSESGSSARPMSLVVRNGHGTLDNSELQILEAKIIEQTRRNAELEGKLAAAEHESTEYKQKYILQQHKWRSQQGSLLAAQRHADELKRANPSIAHYIKVRKEHGQMMKTQGEQLRKAREKLAELECELRAEKCRTAQLEASLATAEVQARGEKSHQKQDSISPSNSGFVLDDTLWL